ncbi:XorII very short patch repair endonuclease Vsr [Crenothrix polyspora]|uniref:Very short patch repair endonuclease n=1 Tax=Crenothrix polyspora TaxID=360316 RepID=A0A1R4GZV6_9GAMM|nr:very short patch repair endonuclease [Crenothrix polyspora]SJM89484.1 XorII very short patch repair endonuclease Vsr [Crenothrix polyspora]
MTDRIDQASRSRIMSAIRSHSTRPEMKVRSALHKAGFRFRLHAKKLPGTPDLVLRKYKAIVFINGCFWHQHPHCKNSHIPKTHSEFWRHKFARNVARDQKVLYQLKLMGWRVAILWECGLTKKQFETTLERLALWLKWGGEYLEIPVYDEFYEL